MSSGDRQRRFLAASAEGLPRNIREAVEAVAELERAHAGSATPQQRFAARVMNYVGTYGFFFLLTGAFLIWVGFNLFASRIGLQALDPPPFNWLQGLVTLLALYMTGIIYATRTHSDKLERDQQRLTLELAMLLEQRSAKMIELLMELRKDSPDLPNKDDELAASMTRPAELDKVMSATNETTKDESEGE